MTLKEAEDRLENLIGPLKLLKLVQDAVERGLPLPFTVSMQQGKATAHVTGERSSKSVSIGFAGWPSQLLLGSLESRRMLDVHRPSLSRLRPFNRSHSQLFSSTSMLRPFNRSTDATSTPGEGFHYADLFPTHSVVCHTTMFPPCDLHI